MIVISSIGLAVFIYWNTTVKDFIFVSLSLLWLISITLNFFSDQSCFCMTCKCSMTDVFLVVLYSFLFVLLHTIRTITEDVQVF